MSWRFSIVLERVKFMKQLFFLILLGSSTLSISGQNNFREIDLRVQGLGSGTSYANVVRKLGRPLRRVTKKYKASEACSGSAETHLSLLYSGMEITLLGDGRGRNLAVYSIEVTSGLWSANGVRIGADARDVVAKFGEPNSKTEKIGETIFHYVTEGNMGGVNFHFRNGRLSKVRMTETLC